MCPLSKFIVIDQEIAAFLLVMLPANIHIFSSLLFPLAPISFRLWHRFYYEFIFLAPS